MRAGTTSENASMYWSQSPLKLLSKNRYGWCSFSPRPPSGKRGMTIHRAKWMNDSMWSFFSVNVAWRPNQNTAASRKRPPGLTGVRTVIAVALPSTFATGRHYRSARGASRSARRCR
jgi:hypothetical protein